VVVRPPAVEAKPASKVPWVVAVALVLVVAAVLTFLRLVPSAPGLVQLSSTPWAEVVTVQKVGGGRVNITGKTPILLSLPPGKYTVELKSATRTEKTVELTVVAGKPTVYNHVFSDSSVDGMVNELVSKY